MKKSNEGMKSSEKRREKENQGDMIITALLLAVGLVLHTITPPVFGGIKPDFCLAVCFWQS